MASNISSSIEFVTTTIMSLLRDGNIPWIMPYEEGACQARSFQTKKEYSLSNKMFIFCQTGKNSGEFVGYKFIESNNLSLKEGAQPVKIVFAMSPHYYEDKKNNNEKKWYGGFTKTYIVYNVKDVCGISEEYTSSDNIKFKNADDVISNYLNKNGVKIYHINETPSYNSLRDEIFIPDKEKFSNETAFYKILFHELIHSTRLKDRCNRLKGVFSETASKDQDEYAIEELVAEIGSAYLACICNLPRYIETFTNTAAYCQGWYNKLQENPAMFFKAAKEAEKAINYILEC